MNCGVLIVGDWNLPDGNFLGTFPGKNKIQRRKNWGESKNREDWGQKLSILSILEKFDWNALVILD